MRVRVDLERRLDGAVAVGAHKMSMLQDLEAGRSLEIEPLVGVVQELGRLTGVPTPTIDIVLALVRQRASTAGAQLEAVKVPRCPRLLESAAPLRSSCSPLNVAVSFRDQAYAALKQAITDADIYAHREEIRLDERQLSQALGVSRTPIREAMTLLEQEGFLRTVPRRGIFIVRKTKKQIIEMIEMWAALESMAARLATLNASDEDIAAAAAHVRRVPQRRRRPSTSTNTPRRTSRSTRRSSGSRARTSWARRSRTCSSTCARSAG